MKNGIVRILEENTRILSLLKRIPLRDAHFRPMELPEPPREAPVPPRGLKRPQGTPESTKEGPSGAPRSPQGVPKESPTAP